MKQQRIPIKITILLFIGNVIGGIVRILSKILINIADKTKDLFDAEFNNVININDNNKIKQ